MGSMNPDCIMTWFEGAVCHVRFLFLEEPSPVKHAANGRTRKLLLFAQDSWRASDRRTPRSCHKTRNGAEGGPSPASLGRCQ
jgi:hypothetical protein